MAELLREFVELLYKDLLVPAIGIIMAVILQQLAVKAKQVMNSADDRNHKESLRAVSSITTQAIDQVDTVVSSAVAYTMKLAEAYKADDTPKLTEEEISYLNKQTRELAYQMMPTEITTGSLSVILGGKESLDAMINASIEKQLILMRNKQTH